MTHSSKRTGRKKCVERFSVLFDQHAESFPHITQLNVKSIWPLCLLSPVQIEMPPSAPHFKGQVR